jgi:hypothetical protein
LRHRASDVIRNGDVARDLETGGVVSTFEAAREARYTRTFLSQPIGNGPADSSARPRDQGNPTA